MVYPFGTNTNTVGMPIESVNNSDSKNIFLRKESVSANFYFSLVRRREIKARQQAKLKHRFQTLPETRFQPRQWAKLKHRFRIATPSGNEVSTSSLVFKNTKPTINSGFQMPNSTTRII